MGNPIRSFVSKLRSIPDRNVEQSHFDELKETLDEMREKQKLTSKQLQERFDNIDAQLEGIHNTTAKTFDHTFELRRDLLKVRQSEEYELLYKEERPLVSVRIPTWNKTDLLIERAIASVQAQTYDNWEIIIVGDGCDEQVERRIAAVGDSRITYYNFPHRNVYPDDPHKHWQVAGSPGMNKGAELAQGQWIAPLDDDDEFTPDHIEVLLNKAQEGQFEFVYGDLAYVLENDGATGTLSSYPPVRGGISTQAMIYPKILGFFEWEMNSWVIDEPGDWNFVRRMMEAGVRMGKVDQVVATIYSLPPEFK